MKRKILLFVFVLLIYSIVLARGKLPRTFLSARYGESLAYAKKKAGKHFRYQETKHFYNYKMYIYSGKIPGYGRCNIGIVGIQKKFAGVVIRMKYISNTKYKKVRSSIIRRMSKEYKIYPIRWVFKKTVFDDGVCRSIITFVGSQSCSALIYVKIYDKRLVHEPASF